MADERLELRYVPLAEARRWDENPKLHDIGALSRSIELHGFGDPPKYDAALGALVYGNGRSEALAHLKEAGREPPRGIFRLDGGEWAMPVLFGVDASSRENAIFFALDHNCLGLLGGNLGFEELVGLWDEVGLRSVLSELPKADEMLASLDCEDVATLLDGPSFEPVLPADQSRLDEAKATTCPACGHEF